jgi:hypothetical protein
VDRIGFPFELDAYVPVAERVRLFYASHPNGRIVTELISRTDAEVVFKAIVYRSATEELPAATGWASERQGDSEINLVACLENTETSAVGRALANLGFTASRHRPSAEEMVKASRARVRFNRQLEPPKRFAEQPHSSFAVATRRAPHPDATLDAMRLVAAAARSGLSVGHREALEQKLRAGVSLFSIERLETALRKFLASRDVK